MARCLWIILPGEKDCQLLMLAIKSDDLFKINFAEALLLVLSNATDLISHNLSFGGRDTENQASDYITSPGLDGAGKCKKNINQSSGALAKL